jgi:hypothetical protein
MTTLSKNVTKLKTESLEGFKLLNNIFKNIISHPEDDKYRHIKKSNQKLAKFLSPPMIQLLKIGGFTETNEMFSYLIKDVEKLKDTLWLIEKCDAEPEGDSIKTNVKSVSVMDVSSNWGFIDSHEILVDKNRTTITFNAAKDAPRTAYCGPIWSSGTYIWEITILSTTAPSNIMIGVANPEIHTNTHAFLSHGPAGWSYYGYYGSSYHQGKSLTYGEPFLTGDVIMVYLNLDEGTLEFYKNGMSQGRVHYDNISGILSAAVSLYSKGDSLFLNSNRNELLMKKKQYDFESSRSFVSESGPLKFTPGRGISIFENKAKFIESKTTPRTIFGNQCFANGIHAWEFKILSTGLTACDIQIGVTDPYKNKNNCIWITNATSTWAIWGQFGLKINGGNSEIYGEGDFTQGDIVSVLLDCDSATLEFFKNSEYLGFAFVDVIGGVAPFVTLSDPLDEIEILVDLDTEKRVLAYKRVKVDHTNEPLKWRRANGILMTENSTIATAQFGSQPTTAFSNKVFQYGKHMWEVTVLHTDVASNIMVGVCDSSVDRVGKRFLTHGLRGWSYYAYDGTAYFQSKSKVYRVGYSTGDVITVVLDLDKTTLEFYKNGKYQGVAFTDIYGPISPAITLYSVKDSVKLEFDQEKIKTRLQELELERKRDIEIENGPLMFKSTQDVEITDGNLKAKMTQDGIATTLIGTKVLLSGKLEWEIKIEKTSNPTSIMIGICDPNVVKKSNKCFLSTSKGWSFCGQDGSAYTSAKGKSYGETFGEGDVIRVVVNLDLKTLEFYKNGFYQGIAFSDISGPVSPAITLYSIDDQVSMITDLKEIKRDVKIEMEDLYD